MDYESQSVATNDTANVVGVFFARVSGRSIAGGYFTVRCMCYVLSTGGDLLSQECLVQLGVLPPSFPAVGQFADNLEERTETVYKSSTLNMIKSGGKQLAKQPVGECDPESILPVSSQNLC